MVDELRIVVLKPSKYTPEGFVERFRRGFMPNSTVPHVRSMTPECFEGTPVTVHSIDEYVHTNLQYLSLLREKPGVRTLLALVGVQSHQLHRALDLAALAKKQNCLVILGGPHVMTCDTSLLHGRGISFALSEAELVWHEILSDALEGELKPLYGLEQRWQQQLEAPVIVPPAREDLSRYVIPMLGLYPARGCPFVCNFCSVIKIAGRKIRSQSVDTTLASLRAAKSAGVTAVMFTSDNFNKYPDAANLLTAMIDEKLNLEIFVQCDTQIARQPELVELLGRAGCFQMFLGVESFNRETLLAARKGQNRPETYREIVRLCRANGIGAHFSNIIGFPTDTEKSIFEHLDALRSMGPSCASFYILCPIPGTEQYDDFLAQGLITEQNLDRFDTTSLTWRHPGLSAAQLRSLLFECYRQFFSGRHLVSNLRNRRQLHSMGHGTLCGIWRTLVLTSFNRYCAWSCKHPMSGGIASVRRDRAADYASLRRATYDLDLVPLPHSLRLNAGEERLQAAPSRSIDGAPSAL